MVTAMQASLPMIVASLMAPPAGWLTAKLVSHYADDAPSPRWPVTIPLTLAIVIWAALARLPVPVFWASLGLGWALACLAIIDLAALRLPDVLTLPLLASGLLMSAFLPGRPIADHLAGAAIGYGALAALAWAYEKARGREGVGLGDAKLLGAAGAWLGWRDLPSVVLIACAAAFLWVGVLAIARGRAALRDPLAFGVPLCLAVWIVWLYGPLAV